MRLLAHHLRLGRRVALLGSVLPVVGLVGCLDAAAPQLDEVSAAATVDDFETTACSTDVVLPLSRQIADEVHCMLPDALVSFDEEPGLVFAGTAVLPYMAAGALVDLRAAIATGGTVELTSAYRTVAQQYLLHRWWELGRCGITVAAPPGESNHESGRAIDVGNHEDWVEVLEAHGWAHDVPGDDVHFDHLDSPDLRGSDVEAFQRLWNRNHPDDRIAEDGEYGAATAARVGAAPADGFPLGATCIVVGHAAELIGVDVPARLAAGARATVTVRARNTGDAVWAAGTALVTAPAGRASALASDAWEAPDTIVRIPDDVAPGATATLDVVVQAPALTATTELVETFALADADLRFGRLELRVIVVADDVGKDPDDEEPDGSAGGGCATGPGGAGLAPLGLLAALVVVGRRRPRRA